METELILSAGEPEPLSEHLQLQTRYVSEFLGSLHSQSGAWYVNLKPAMGLVDLGAH